MTQRTVLITRSCTVARFRKLVELVRADDADARVVGAVQAEAFERLVDLGLDDVVVIPGRGASFSVGLSHVARLRKLRPSEAIVPIDALSGWPRSAAFLALAGGAKRRVYMAEDGSETPVRWRDLLRPPSEIERRSPAPASDLGEDPVTRGAGTIGRVLVFAFAPEDPRVAVDLPALTSGLAQQLAEIGIDVRLARGLLPCPREHDADEQLRTIDDLKSEFNAPAVPLVTLDESVGGDLSWLEIGEESDLPGSLTVDGVDLWAVIQVSLAKTLNCIPDLTRPEHRDVARQMTRNALLARRTISQVLDAEAPDQIIVFGGVGYAQRLAVFEAQRRGIKAWATEVSAFGDRAYFESEGIVGNSHSAGTRSRHRLETSALTADQRNRLADYLSRAFNVGSTRILQPSAGSPDAVREKLDLPDHGRIALLLGQVAVDSVMVLDSAAFERMVDFIEAVVEVFACHEDWHLVVRFHPAESHVNDDASYRHFAERELPENITLVHGYDVNTYALMEIASVGLTTTSQAGLEMLIKQRPVMLVGRAFYGQQGFTRDCLDHAAFAPMLDDLLGNPSLTESEREMRDRYVHHLIFNYLLPCDRRSARFTPSAIERILGRLRSRDVYC